MHVQYYGGMGESKVLTREMEDTGELLKSLSKTKWIPRTVLAAQAEGKDLRVTPARWKPVRSSCQADLPISSINSAWTLCEPSPGEKQSGDVWGRAQGKPVRLSKYWGSPSEGREWNGTVKPA